MAGVMSGWLKLSVFILAYEIRHSRDGKLLSEEADRWIAKRPILARAAIGFIGLALTAHVGNFLHEDFDFISNGFWRRHYRTVRRHF